MYYPCSENKDADQLRGYREADLWLCFRPCKLLVFSRTGSFVNSTPGLHLASVVAVCGLPKKTYNRTGRQNQEKAQSEKDSHSKNRGGKILN